MKLDPSIIQQSSTKLSYKSRDNWNMKKKKKKKTEQVKA